MADKLDSPLFCEGKLVLGALEEVPVVLVCVGKVLIRYHPSMVLDVRWLHLLLVLNVVDKTVLILEIPRISSSKIFFKKQVQHCKCLIQWILDLVTLNLVTILDIVTVLPLTFFLI